MARKNWQYQTPDTRLRHLTYARQQEEERAKRLDAQDAERMTRIQGEMQVEQERSAGLDGQDTVQEELRFEEKRKADLDVAGAPQYEPGGRVLPEEVAPYLRQMGPRWRQWEKGIFPAPGDPGMEPLTWEQQRQRAYEQSFGKETLLEKGVGEAVEHVVEPAIRGVRYVEEPVAAAALQAVSRTGPLGGPALGPGQQIAEMPMERQPIGEELVNPIAAYMGDEEEQRKVQEVLEEAGLPATITAMVITSPLNLLPIVGFTSGRGFVNTLRQAARTTGPARQAIVQSPRFQSTIRAIASEAGGRVPGGELSIPQRIHKIHTRLARDWDMERLGPEVLGPEDVSPIAKQRVIAEFGDDPTITLYRGIGPGERPPTWGKRVAGEIGESWSTEPERAALYARGGRMYRVDAKASELANPVGTPDPVGIRATKAGDEFVLPLEIQRRATAYELPAGLRAPRPGEALPVRPAEAMPPGMPSPVKPPVPGNLPPPPEWEVVAARIRQQFPEAQKLWKGTSLTRRAQMKERTAQYFKVLDKQLAKGTELEEAKRIASLEYKGEMADLKFAEAFITTPEELNAMNRRGLTYARETGHVHEWEDAYNAIAAMAEKRVPRPHEIKYIRRIYGDGLADAIAGAAKDRDWWEVFMDAWMVPKAVRSAFDISFPARQGIMVAPRHPIMWSKSLATSARAMADPDWMARETKRILGDATPVPVKMPDGSVQALKFGDVVDDMGIVLERVEPFYRGQLAEKIPLLGIGVKRSNIAFAGAGNRLRTDMTRHWLNTWAKSGVDITPERLERLGALMNALTGRATIPKGWMFELLQATWWSPQYRLAGPQVLGTILKHGVGAAPLRMGKPLIASADPLIAGIAAQNLVAFVGGGIGVLSMLKASGLADVELDPRSSDFGKIQLGPTRINFFGTSQLLTRTIAQAITGTRIDPELGPQAQFRGDPLKRYWQSGASPEFSLLYDAITGETYLGERMYPSEERGISLTDIVRRETDPTVPGGAERTLPLAWLDIKEAVEEDAVRGGIIGGLGMVGLGVQSYEPKAAQELQNVPEFEGGLDQRQINEVGDFLREVDEIRDDWRLNQGREVGVEEAIRYIGQYKELDPNFIEWAVRLRYGTKSREKLRNPEWVQFIVEHADEIREDRPDLLKRNYIIDAIREAQSVAPMP